MQAALSWTYEDAEGFDFGPPSVYNGIVYASSGSELGSVFAVDARTGELLWKSERVGADNEQYVAVRNGLVFVEGYVFTPPSPVIFALNAKNGNQEWCTEAPNLVISAPTASHEALYMVDEDGSLVALEVTTGRAYWLFDMGVLLFSEADTVGSPVFSDGVLYLDNGEGTLYAIDRYNGTELWHLSVGTQYMSAPVVTGGFVILTVKISQEVGTALIAIRGS